IAVPNDLIPRRGSSYVLRVRGESMIDEHIQDGDFVVVHGRNTASSGEMVIALVHGTSATVKRMYREAGGWIRLQPSNAQVKPIRVHEDDELVQGVVVGVIRKYGCRRASPTWDPAPERSSLSASFTLAL